MRVGYAGRMIDEEWINKLLNSISLLFLVPWGKNNGNNLFKERTEMFFDTLLP